ncbi:MAG: hypothetical protein AUH33_06500 [Chloroflexi bacterium 13_1_40CM_68_21]|nr:MAG: hypothetical protein AUH33_06500 [Chloroflexi bacterium 13_1_40CM_68_21]
MKLFDWYSSGATREHGDERFKPKERTARSSKRCSRPLGRVSPAGGHMTAGGWNGTHPVNGVPVVVLTRRAPKKVPKGKSTFTFTDDPEDAVKNRQASGRGHGH